MANLFVESFGEHPIDGHGQRDSVLSKHSDDIRRAGDELFLGRTSDRPALALVIARHGRGIRSRFVAAVAAFRSALDEQSSDTWLTVILNWFEELKQRVPTGR